MQLRVLRINSKTLRIDLIKVKNKLQLKIKTTQKHVELIKLGSGQFWF